ncbi:hypothetical protein ACFS7Z_13880 [Pontibacter toksunensis]|uniref:Uncharacterized protein n=1 Tax=Pontibacter toksunensis TaxID=1332631 RepID=A0ABW6BWQ9_9BACT
MKKILLISFCSILLISSSMAQITTQTIKLERSESNGKYVLAEDAPKEVQFSNRVEVHVPKPNIPSFVPKRFKLYAGESIALFPIETKQDQLVYRFRVRRVVNSEDKQLKLKVVYDYEDKGEVPIGEVSVGIANSSNRVVVNTDEVRTFYNLTSALNNAVSAAKTTVGQTLYSKENNSAAFVVDQFGTIYASPEDQIDDNDKVYVYTIKPQSMRLKISLTSPLRNPLDRFVLGQEEFDEESDDVIVYNYERSAEIKDFKYGEVIVSIRQIVDENSLKDIGSFQFVANRLYYGAYHFGPIFTFLEDQEFGLVETESGNKIYVKDEQSPRIHYIIGFSPFIFGKKDIEKDVISLDPFIGATLNDLGDNALLGVSLGRPGFFYLLGGVHVGKVTRLEDTSGLKEGSPFDKQENEIPTEDRWKSDFFIGASFDLQAALRIFRSIINR